MLIDQLNQLFIYVPAGYGQDYINECSQQEQYKKKIAFVYDTKQIWVQGQGFGISAQEFQALQQLVRDNKDELDAKIADTSTYLSNKIDEIAQEQGLDTSTLVQRLNILEGDENTPGSVAYAVEKLKQLIMGADMEEIQKAYDTIKEIADWIAETGVADLEKLTEDVSTNAAAIEEERERAMAAEDMLDTRVTDLEDVDIWMIYESDNIPAGDNTYGMSSVQDFEDNLAGVDDTTQVNVTVDTQDALGYFTDPDNSNVTFQNIQI